MFKRIILSVLVLIIIFTNTSCAIKTGKLGDNEYGEKLKYSAVTSANPLKGFFAWGKEETDFPTSLKYYGFPLKDVQLDTNTFDFTVLEDKLEECKAYGKQAVIRFYIDYPGEDIAIPDFLLENEDIEFRKYTLEDGASGLTPDYSNAELQQALVNFIAELGSKYDGDSRIGFIEAGLLGFWGEWHTYPYTEWYPDSNAYKTIGQAFDDAFDTTKIVAGEVQENIADLAIGFHDDMMAVETKEVKNNLEEIGNADKWKTEPMGGEIAPTIQDKYFQGNILGYFSDSISWSKTLKLTHPSWALVNSIYEYTGREREKAIKASNEMGYEFTVEYAKTYYNTSSNSLDISLDLKNKGIAPFYYNWDIELKVSDSNGNEVATETTYWDLRTITEMNTTYNFNYSMKDVFLDENSTYTVSMRVVNPMEGGMPLLFANKTQNDDGWLELIDFNVDIQ